MRPCGQSMASYLLFARRRAELVLQLIISTFAFVVLQTITAQLRRSQVDPFTQAPLFVQELMPLPELRSRIEAWQDSRLSKAGEGGRVDSKDLISSSSDSGLNPELLEMLTEAESMCHVARRANVDAREDDWRRLRRGFADDRGRIGGLEIEMDVGEQGEEKVSETDGNDAWDAWDPIGDDSFTHGAAASRAHHGRRLDARHKSFRERRRGRMHNTSRRREHAKVLNVSSKSCSIDMYAPGAGQREFHFAGVFDEDAEQVGNLNFFALDQVAILSSSTHFGHSKRSKSTTRQRGKRSFPA